MGTSPWILLLCSKLTLSSSVYSRARQKDLLLREGKGASKIAHKRGPKNGLKRQEEAASYQGLILHPSPSQLVTFLQARGLPKA